MGSRHSEALVALLLLTGAAWLGCGGDGSGPSSSATLTGVGRAAGSGAPVSGAAVALDIRRVITDQDGRYELPNVPTGSVTIVVTAAGFDQYAETFAIQDGTNSHDVSLVRKTLYELGEVVAYLPPEVSTYRGVYFLVPGFGGDARPLIRGQADPAGVEYRRRAVERAVKYGLAVAGSNSLPLTVESYDLMRTALSSLAGQSGRPELGSAPMLLDGWSNGACLVFGFSRLHGERVIGFVAQKLCGNPLTDGMEARSVPGYFLVGEQDTPERVAKAIQVFEVNRAAGAPWAVVIEPGVGHVLSGVDALFHWFDAVLALRLPDAPGTLRPMDQSSGWLGDRATFGIAPHACYGGAELEASWLPSEPTAREWQHLASAGTVATVIPCGNAR